MKTFAFVPTTSLKQAYTGLLAKYKQQDWIMDLLKIGFLASILVFSFFVYLIYVSRSSTLWYFLRKENQNLNTISFRYEILKTQILEQKQRNRESILNASTKKEVITILK